nr:hypothetical protein [Tanacetum cinerariifolium]
MNPQKLQQIADHDEKWVPSAERLKISSTNIRQETTVAQKEETFQVVIDIIKNSTCFKAFTISADVPEIFMQQFRYTIKKVQGMESYEFFVANKKCVVNADVFKTILGISPRVEGVDFIDVPGDNTSLTFLVDLGYKGSLNRHTNMFVDHMHQPWRTLAAIIISIDHRKEKRSRRENMPYPRFTKIIINHFLKKHESLANLNHKQYHTIKDDEIVSRLKFVRIDEDYQEYGLPIPNEMRSDAIKSLESYQMFIKYSTNQIRPKKSRGKGSQAKKGADTVVEEVDVFDESEPEPVSAKKKLASKRRVKKKVTLSAEDDIISNDPDASLVLAKSISQTKAEEAEVAKKVHATHARIVTEPIPNPASRRISSKGTTNSPKKLKAIPSLTPVEQEAANVMKDLKESKSPTKDNQESEHFDDDKDEDAAKVDKYDDVDDEGDVHINNDVEMKESEVEEIEKGEEEVTDAAKNDAEMTSKVKDDPKKTKLPQISSSLSISSCFSDQSLKLSFDSSLASIVNDTADTDKVHVSVIPETINLSPSQFNLTETSVSTVVSTPQVTPIIPPIQQTTTPIPTSLITTKFLTITIAISGSNALIYVEIRVAKLEQEVSELKNIDHSSEVLATLESNVLAIANIYLDSQMGALEEYDLKSALYQCMHANQSFNKNHANHRLFYALMKALIDVENAMDRGVADTVKDHKRKHNDDDEGPSAGPNQGKQTKRRRTKDLESSKKPLTIKETPKGKALSKGSKAGKSASAKETIKESITEVVMDDSGEDVAHDDSQPQDTSESKTRKTQHLEWFKQPPRLPTPDPEWNKHQECFNALKNRLDWNNPEGDRYPFDMSKPLPLQGPPGHRTVPVDFFFNKDLEYLKTSDPEVTYTTSITKTKATWYDIKGIEDMVNNFSKHNVYSTKAILDVKSVKVEKLYGYGHLQEIVVKSSDQQFYTFKEGDFVDHLNDIEDMLLLAIQHKLFHLDGNNIVDFIVALRMFTRSLILKKRVKDLHLGVESYQKKLNITAPQKTFLEIKFKKPYTPSQVTPGLVYEDRNKQKRVMRADELYKFSDGTLKSVRDELHHRVLNFRRDYIK